MRPGLSPSLTAMLTSPGWRDVVVLGGGADPGPRLTGSVVALEVSVHPEPLDGQVLVVLLAGDHTDWRIDALISRASAAGAGAVLLAGVEPLGRGAQLLAERLQLPVLGCPDPLAAHEHLRRVTAEPEVVRSDLVLRAVSALRRANGDLASVLRTTAGVLERPVTLAGADGGTLDGDPLEPEERKALVAALPRVPIGWAAPYRVDLASGAVLIAVAVLGVGPVCWLVARLPAVVPAEVAAVPEVLSVVAPAVGERLALRRLELERDARQRTSLLGELLHGEPSEATRRRAVDLGWQVDGWHTGIRIGADGQVDVAGRRTDVVEAFDAEGLQAVVVEQGDGWSAWITAVSEPTATEVQEQAATIRRVQRRLVQTVDAYVGVGRVQAGPSGIATTLAEAGDAAGLARGRAETGRFLHVDRLGLAQLLLAWTRTDTFQPAAQALLAPIKDQPGDLVTTLAVYLDTESSVAETAAVLGIHRNTAAARIQKIQHLLGVDLTNPDERLALHLASRTTPVE
ncbi:PucR-like helix-turn-helix protein [Kribbella rubisoli]|uniref:PucR-like helix-turn-helix protein n=1 Tax=Kribbella rubisoli TaxID=3075929 RepID=A0A4V6MF70_9ACTN|nr:PucR family transcriptional regulator [Kribbella rubisoli]RZU18446.1 PucR-like helix-turn-helix protein [Kribbella rubisoli]